MSADPAPETATAAEDRGAAAPARPAARPSFRRRTARRSPLLGLVDTPASAAAAVAVLLVIVAAILAQLLAPYNPTAQALGDRLVPPLQSARSGNYHLLGTDALGRDILSRLIFGSRISLIVGAASVLVAGAIGVALGLLAGYLQRGWDSLIMRVGDVQLAIPFLVLALATVAAVGPSLFNLIVILGVTGWVQYARVVRAETLSVKRREYVDAVRVLGATPARILLRHILPNVTSSVIVVGTLQVSRMILFEASLSFLGLGVPPPTPTWGGMVADGRTYVDSAWWVSTVPGLTIFFAVLAITILGDRLRDILDPRLRDV